MASHDDQGGLQVRNMHVPCLLLSEYGLCDIIITM